MRDTSQTLFIVWLSSHFINPCECFTLVKNRAVVCVTDINTILVTRVTLHSLTMNIVSPRDLFPGQCEPQEFMNILTKKSSYGKREREREEKFVA